MRSMWTYYRVLGGSYVRLDEQTMAAEEFDPEAVPGEDWEPMDAWYSEITHNGTGTKVAEDDALAAVEVQRLQYLAASR